MIIIFVLYQSSLTFYTRSISNLMAPVYKLIYFVSRGVAETSRFLLKHGGIEFEDVRIEKKDWPQLKEKTPFGVLPILEYQGKQVHQSAAITRYIAKQVKLAGNDDWEDLEIDAIVDTLKDFLMKLLPIFYEDDEIKKEPLLKIAFEETVPFYLSRLEDTVKRSNGFLAVGRLTWADFHFAHISTFFDYITKTDLLSEYPNLRRLRESIHNLPAIKEWIKTRPDLDFENVSK